MNKAIFVLFLALFLFNCNENEPKTVYNISIRNLKEYIDRYGENAVLDSITQSTFVDSLDMMSFWYSSAMFDSIWHLRATQIESMYASNNLMKIFCVYAICSGEFIKYANDTGSFVMMHRVNHEIVYDFYCDNSSRKNRGSKLVSADSIYAYYENWKKVYRNKGYKYIKDNKLLPIAPQYVFDFNERVVSKVVAE